MASRSSIRLQATTSPATVADAVGDALLSLRVGEPPPPQAVSAAAVATVMRAM